MVNFIGILLFLLMAAFLVYGVFSLTNSGNLFIRRYFLGQTIILVYNGQYGFNRDFLTFVPRYKKDLLGVDMVYTVRYPEVDVGVVMLYPDGKADYCGSYSWKII